MRKTHRSSMLRKVLYSLLFIGSALVLFAGIYFLAAWLLPKVSVNGRGTPGPVTVHILSNGVHTDLVLPVRHGGHDWRVLIDPTHVEAPDPAAAWVAFGWGDKGFYLETPTWADLKASTAMKAVLGLGGSAMHVTWHRELREGPMCRRFTLSEEAYAALVAHITSSFVLTPSGRPMLITGTHYEPTDAFYEAHGRYQLFHTCNGWTNEALKTSGARACMWTPFQAGLMDQYAPGK